ncbi:MAG UNVERIFIED_CONTAM: hypothetical protein LVR29_30020 [Microcystis novacekii LVE1205-3]
MAGAIALITLWPLHHWLSQRTSKLALLYARACDGWAILLCSLGVSRLNFLFPSRLLGSDACTQPLSS